jgi:hypothetical protein
MRFEIRTYSDCDDFRVLQSFAVPPSSYRGHFNNYFVLTFWDVRREKSLYVLPEDVSGKQTNLGIRIDTKNKGEHILTLKKMSLYS